MTEPDVVVGSIGPLHSRRIASSAPKKDVRPISTAENVGDCFGFDAMLGGDLPPRHSAVFVLVHGKNNRFGQFGVGVEFSNETTMLSNHVLRVVRMSSGEQMRWIATRRIVA